MRSVPIGLNRTAPDAAVPPRAPYNGRMQIGPYTIAPNVVLAPMAGVTDKPFRLLCKRLGAGLAASEMTISDPRFWNTRKSIHRMDHDGEPAQALHTFLAGHPMLMSMICAPWSTL